MMGKIYYLNSFLIKRDTIVANNTLEWFGPPKQTGKAHDGKELQVLFDAV